MLPGSTAAGAEHGAEWREGEAQQAEEGFAAWHPYKLSAVCLARGQCPQPRPDEQGGQNSMLRSGLPCPP